MANRLVKACRIASSKAPMVFGALVFFLAWEVIGRRNWLGPSFPPLSNIFYLLHEPASFALLQRSSAVTLIRAFHSLLFATLIATILMVVSLVAHRLSKGLESLSSSIYAIPSIAYAPVLILVAGPDATPTLLGIVSAFFPIFVTLSSELRLTPLVYTDLTKSLGANKTQALLRITGPYAIPALVDGLRLGAPGALLGVIVGEWFGASKGLGVLILSSLQNVRITLLWASALAGALMSLIVYMFLSAALRAARVRFAW